MNGTEAGRPALLWPEATELAERLVAVAGGSVRSVLLYGSRLLSTGPDRHSALDFVVIVDAYRPFYDALARAGELHRPVGLMTVMAGALPPNVIAYAPGEGGEGIAKCLVVSRSHFEAGLGPTPPDHFLIGRMVQRLGVLWTASAEEGAWVAAQVEGAHRRVLDWMAPFIHAPLDAEGLGRRLLEVCYRGELRPESAGRAGRVFEAQAAHFGAVLEPTLLAAVASGLMRREGDLFVLASPAPAAQGRRWRAHFRRSKRRATLRWFKHTATFANWLPYVVRKAERHTGRSIELTHLERKLPFIFLWPRVVYVLVSRPRREIES